MLPQNRHYRYESGQLDMVQIGLVAHVSNIWPRRDRPAVLQLGPARARLGLVHYQNGQHLDLGDSPYLECCLCNHRSSHLFNKQLLKHFKDEIFMILVCRKFEIKFQLEEVQV